MNPNKMRSKFLMKPTRKPAWVVFGCLVLMMLSGWLTAPGWARSNFAPWLPSNQQDFGSLVCGASTPADVQRVAGPPDEVVHSEQMFPVIENYYYYDAEGSGSASIFVFQNGLLVGLHYKSPDNQLVDLTYFLTNNGDMALNRQLNAGYAGYYPTFPFYQWY
jgi:hypothetical protein